MLQLKRIFSSILLFFFLSFGIVAQEVSIPDVLGDYPSLLDEYETLLNDYDELLTDYETLLDDYDGLLTKFDNLSTQYSGLVIEFDNTNTLYEGEITYHENSIKALDIAEETITMLEGSIEDLLGIVDPRYMAFYLQAGYQGTQVTGGIGFSVDVPKIPISFLVDLDYLHGNEYPINIQVGVGIRF